MRSVRGEFIFAGCAKVVSARENELPDMLSVVKMCKACVYAFGSMLDCTSEGFVICCAFVRLYV